MSDDKLPPCPICGADFTVLGERPEIWVQYGCAEGHEFLLEDENQLRALCAAVERGKNADTKML